MARDTAIAESLLGDLILIRNGEEAHICFALAGRLRLDHFNSY